MRTLTNILIFVLAVFFLTLAFGIFERFAHRLDTNTSVRIERSK